MKTLETVYLKDINLYNKNPLKYCKEVLGLIDPCIIYPKIMIGSLFNIDNRKIVITGRSGNRFVCHHTYQLSINDEYARYLKNLAK